MRHSQIIGRFFSHKLPPMQGEKGLDSLPADGSPFPIDVGISGLEHFGAGLASKQFAHMAPPPFSMLIFKAYAAKTTARLPR